MENRKMKSRGQEIVLLYGDRYRKAVYQPLNNDGTTKGEFYVKHNNEYIRVYHQSYYFSTEE